MKICAAKGLQISPSARALAPLCDLLSHQDSLLRRLAGDAIIHLKFEASNSLITILQNGGHIEKIEAARALSFIQDPMSVRTLFDQLEGAPPNLEYWINNALEKMGIGMQFFSPSV